MNINLIIATAKCLDEQLANMDGVHTHRVKQYFNRLNHASMQYVKEIDKMFADGDGGERDQIDNLYDQLMEVIYQVRDITMQQDGQRA